MRSGRTSRRSSRTRRAPSTDARLGLRLVLSCLLLALGTAVSPGLRAAPAANERTAEVLVAEGDQRAAANDAAGAAERYQQAFDLSGDPETGLKLGRAYDKLGRLARAHAVLSAVGSTKVPKDKKAASAAVKAAAEEAKQVWRRVPWLRLLMMTPAPDAPGVAVTVDGAPAVLGVWVAVDPGAHPIVAAATDFAKLEKSVTIKEGERQTVELVLTSTLAPPTPPPGKLSVKVADGAPATLFVDGKAIGPVPWVGELPAGEHELQAQGQNGRSAVTKVTVASEKQTELTLQILPDKGTLQIRAANDETGILLDNVPVGRGQWKGEVVAGKHQVGFATKDGPPDVRVVEVVAGKLTTVEPPPPDADAAAAAYTGAYVRFAPALLFQMGEPSDELQTDCMTGASCSATAGAGLGLRVGVGYGFGVAAVEWLVLGSIDRWKEDVKFAGGTLPREESYEFYRFGAGTGVALRLSSKGETFRVTGAAGGGVALRIAQYKRSTKTIEADPVTDDVTGSAETFFTPLATADLGVLIGKTPGTKFYIGVLAYADFTPFSVPASDSSERKLGTGPTGVERAQSTPELDLVSKPAFFIGPSLGVQLGR